MSTLPHRGFIGGRLAAGCYPRLSETVNNCYKARKGRLAASHTSVSLFGGAVDEAPDHSYQDHDDGHQGYDNEGERH